MSFAGSWRGWSVGLRRRCPPTPCTNWETLLVLRIRRLDWASAVHGRVRAQPHSFCLAYLFVKPFAISPVCEWLALRFTCRLRCTPSFCRAQSAGPKRPPAATACQRATKPSGARIGAKLVRIRPRRSRDGFGPAAGNSTRGLDPSRAALLGGEKIVRRTGAVIRSGQTASRMQRRPQCHQPFPTGKKELFEFAARSGCS